MRRRGLRPQPRNDQTNTGSPETGEPVFIAIGFLRRPHGFVGEILMDLMTDFPERIRKGKTVYLGPQHEAATIHAARRYEGGLLISFVGIDSEESAGQLRNTMVFVRADELPKLPAGEYYHHQLVGLAVYDPKETLLGTLTEILETGANDVFVIKDSGGNELLVPVIEGVIQVVDVKGGSMHINPPEWD